MKMYEGTDRQYANLAAAIVEVAAVDYVDALIVSIKGYLSESEFRRALYDSAIKYGETRYLRKGKYGITRQDERKNMRSVSKIARILEKDSRRRKAKNEIRQLEEFFRSPSFALYMPNTDPESFIRLLRVKAEKGERVRSQYSSRT